jgi:hypothetical protein
MPRLTLIGTIHRDPQGLVRLVQALKSLNPHVITLEFSTYGLRYRLKKKRSLNHCLLRGLHEIHGIDGLRLGALKELLRTTGIGGIRAQLALPFEYKGASFYSQLWGIPLYCVDISSFSRQLLAKVDELLSPKNLKKVIAFETAPLEETVTREYKQAETLLLNERQSPWRHLIPADVVGEKRERIMASRIRRIAAHYAGRHIVHIGGWQYLAAQPGTLFSLLEDLTPKRVLLASLYPEPAKQPSLPSRGHLPLPNPHKIPTL